MPTPIKRTSSLISYSKEHHFGLLLVWKIRQGIKREIITGKSMKGTEHDIDFHKYGYPTKWRSAYRRLFQQKKEFKLETQK